MNGDLYDEAYSSFARSPTARRLFGPLLDPALPTGLEPYSFVTKEMLMQALAALNCIHTDRLVDLGCGRGGPGLWLARELDCNLIGIDRSSIAVTEALSRRNIFPASERIRVFIQGDMSTLPLHSASVDAVVSFDSIQTLDSAEDMLREVRRVLRPGGRFVATTWQAVDIDDDRLQTRLRVDWDNLLKAAGMDDVSICVMEGAHRAEINLARIAVALDSSLVENELILQRVVGEAIETIAQVGLTRRIILHAQAPKGQE